MTANPAGASWWDAGAQHAVAWRAAHTAGWSAYRNWQNDGGYPEKDIVAAAVASALGAYMDSRRDIGPIPPADAETVAPGYAGFSSWEEFFSNVLHDLAGSYVLDPDQRAELVRDVMSSLAGDPPPSGRVEARHREAGAATHQTRRRLEPPCMSCGRDRREVAPDECKDKRSHRRESGSGSSSANG